jgi:hypothetical protein
MRAFARVSCHDEHENNPAEQRLLPQPVYRYDVVNEGWLPGETDMSEAGYSDTRGLTSGWAVLD